MTQTDPITACLIIGGGFSGLGLVFVGLSRPGKSHTVAATNTAQTAPPASAMTPVMLAFLDGLQQGMAARQATKPSR
ncbi:hypothetical protein [Tateyamaria omphalii]|uniref:hypothetical protein n=1 Tax=Tateyamaria omphalii TaxID=299262 RepID=UPI00155FE04E|nr:hypothetical protein [Tateyamaria omphalii]